MSATDPLPAMTLAQWRAEGTRRFGRFEANWKFVCPACGIVTAVSEWKAAGAKEGHVGFSCIGRFTKPRREAFGGKGGPGPCNYAGGGLIGINPQPVLVDGQDRPVHLFAFADAAAPVLTQ